MNLPGRPPPKPMEKIGVPPGEANRGIATSQPLSLSQGDIRSMYSTYITNSDGKSRVLYNGDRTWSAVTLTLQTGGPVSVGDKQNLGTVTSGQGILLLTGVPMKFTIGKGTKLYVASNSIDRIAVQIEPFPWLEMISTFLQTIASRR